MNNKDLELTYFAPAPRAKMEKVKEQALTIMESPDFQRVTNAVSNIIMILNEDRQLLFANNRLCELIQNNNIQNLMGKRPGEILGCIYSDKTTGGCGTSEHCEMCGAVNSIIAGLEGRKNTSECRILTGDGTDAFDLKVCSTPYVVDGENFVIFVVEDIGNEKRRNVLERTFFHDIINTVGGLKGITQLLKEAPESFDEFKDLIFEATDTLMDEINAQKQLLAAENDELALNLHEVNSMQLMKSIADLYSNHTVAEDKEIVVDNNSTNVTFTTDEAIAKRILSNMAKNALEASQTGKVVTISCTEKDDFIDISVHNESVMPREVKLQMFQRSFSTKGAGRGIGTYSIKLLLEKYLHGKISFTSEEGEGTTFIASFPKNQP